MTGYDVLRRICTLLGYSYTESVANKRITEKTQEIITQIALDLKIDCPKSLSDKIIANGKKSEALIYGSAMMLAISENDASHGALFAELYSAKRTSALCETQNRQDVLPTSLLGGM